MPIRPENRGRYPDDWRATSDRIRLERAGRMCECSGQCGNDHRGDDPAGAWEAWLQDPTLAEPETSIGRCHAIHLLPHPVTGSKVVLTVAHLDHQPEHCEDDNLLAMCQRCHLSYDRDHHAATRAATLAAVRAAAGQLELG